MKIFTKIEFFALSLLLIPVSAQAETISATASINCMVDQLPKLAASRDTIDAKEAAKISITGLTEKCAEKFDWTLRQSTAAMLFSSAKIQLAKNRIAWAQHGLPIDLPDRVRTGMTLHDLNELMLERNAEPLSKVLGKELAITGSTLNPDGSIDDLSLEKSIEVGVPLGGIISALFMIEEFEKNI